MNPAADVIATALATAATFAGLWFFLTWAWPDFLTDRLRQDLFSLRDRLFDIAAAGELPFDHPAYISVRWQLNGMIRYAHRFSVVGLVPMAVLMRRSIVAHEQEEAETRRWTESLAAVPEPVQAKLVAIRRDIGATLMRHMVQRSPFSTALLALIVTVLLGVAIPILGWRRLTQIRARERHYLEELAVMGGRNESLPGMFALVR